MKKLILSGLIAAFAVAAQAGNSAGCTGDAPCCAKAKSTSQTKADCPMMGKQANGSCPYAKSAKTTACTKPVLKSPKALG